MSADATPNLLIVDDQPDVLEALRLLLKTAGMRVVAHTTPAEAAAAVAARDFDTALVDLNYARDTTSGKEGLELVDRLRALDAALPIVVMTAWGSVETAVQAMRRGARDYVQKPWENAKLLATLRTHIELGRALRRSQRLDVESARQRSHALPQLIAGSKAMDAVLRLIDRVAPSEANILITGEHGTGKEVVARTVHALSKCAGAAFVPVNTGALSEGLFESELFGHVKGAFTDAKADRVGCFELADGGTLFLDEVANMPLAQQAKLLRVLQTGELHPVGSSRVRTVQTRVLAAANVDLEREVKAGRFREDLLYRLNTVEIRLPPLRERGNDVITLAHSFLAHQAQRYQREICALSDGALAALRTHAWPGNVRELEHVIERAVLMAPGDVIEADDLGLRSRAVAPSPAAASEPTIAGDGFDAMTLEDVERVLVTRALARCDGNVSDAAKALGLSRSALYRRMEQFGLKGSA
jgi:DNA-binding NtrC family response regulator